MSRILIRRAIFTVTLLAPAGVTQSVEQPKEIRVDSIRPGPKP